MLTYVAKTPVEGVVRDTPVEQVNAGFVGVDASPSGTCARGNNTGVAEFGRLVRFFPKANLLQPPLRKLLTHSRRTFA